MILKNKKIKDLATVKYKSVDVKIKSKIKKGFRKYF